MHHFPCSLAVFQRECWKTHAFKMRLIVHARGEENHPHVVAHFNYFLWQDIATDINDLETGSPNVLPFLRRMEHCGSDTARFPLVLLKLEVISRSFWAPSTRVERLRALLYIDQAVTKVYRVTCHSPGKYHIFLALGDIYNQSSSFYELDIFLRRGKCVILVN